MNACTPIGCLGGQEGMKFYSEKYNFWIVYHYQVITKTFSWKNEYKIFFCLEDMAQNGPEYPTCVSNSGENLFPLKIQDNHALLQPKLVFLGSLAIWDDSNRYCFHKIIRLLQNAAKYCKNAAKKHFFAANGIIWKLIHGLLPNLVNRGSLLFLINFNGICF